MSRSREWNLSPDPRENRSLAGESDPSAVRRTIAVSTHMQASTQRTLFFLNEDRCVGGEVRHDFDGLTAFGALVSTVNWIEESFPVMVSGGEMKYRTS